MRAALPARSHALAHTHAPSLASSDVRSPRPLLVAARVAPATPTLLRRSANGGSHTLNTRSVALAEAIRCFRRALAHGDRDTAAKQLAALYAAGGDSERAAKYFRRVLTLHDEDKVGARALASWVVMAPVARAGGDCGCRACHSRPTLCGQGPTPGVAIAALDAWLTSHPAGLLSRAVHGSQGPTDPDGPDALRAMSFLIQHHNDRGEYAEAEQLALRMQDQDGPVRARA